MDRRRFLHAALALGALPACGNGEAAADPALDGVVFQGSATPAACKFRRQISSTG